MAPDGDDLDDDAPAHNIAESLTPRQVLAVEALAAGQSQHDAGAAAGVRRETVGRWLREVPAFRPAVERTTRDLAARQRARVLVLHDRALTVVGEALDSADPDRRDRAAALVLRTATLADVTSLADGAPPVDDVSVEVLALDPSGAAVAARVRARLRARPQ